MAQTLMGRKQSIIAPMTPATMIISGKRINAKVRMKVKYNHVYFYCFTNIISTY